MGFGSTPFDKIYLERSCSGAANLHEMMKRASQHAAALPAGVKWVYSLSIDIQGYMVEKISGKPLPEFMEERIFDPLGMTDTGFFVPNEKSTRFATLYSGGRTGSVVLTPEAWGLGLTLSRCRERLREVAVSFRRRKTTRGSPRCS